MHVTEHTGLSGSIKASFVIQSRSWGYPVHCASSLINKWRWKFRENFCQCMGIVPRCKLLRVLFSTYFLVNIQIKYLIVFLLIWNKIYCRIEGCKRKGLKKNPRDTKAIIIPFMMFLLLKKTFLIHLSYSG